jgi:enoyl-CoA hydratase/carnithine racemase
MNFETILFEKQDGVVKITLNRPHKLNALNARLADEFAVALDKISHDPESRVLVLTGAGRAFCAGADVGIMLGGSQSEQEVKTWGTDQNRQGLRLGFQRITKGLWNLNIPTIASVNGVAVGGGFDMVCACDMVVASENARFMVAYTRRGLFPDLGGFWFIPRAIGIRKAAEMIYTGDFMDAQAAKEWGLLNYLIAPEKLEEVTMDLARRVAAGPPIANRLSRLLMHKGLTMDLDTALEWSATAAIITETSEDHRESVEAFHAKRSAIFRGK